MCGPLGVVAFRGAQVRPTTGSVRSHPGIEWTTQAIYGIEPAAFRQTLDELIDLLELEPLLRRPVRQLSLGERMKCELAAALLHRPQVLFLDEPTIGLDLTLAEMNLTSVLALVVRLAPHKRRIHCVLSHTRLSCRAASV